MSCLAPQFRCPPETTSPHTRTYHNTIFQLLRSRRLPYFQAQCVLSTTSQATSTTVLDMEKLRLLSLEARSNPVASQRPWTYTREISPPAEPNYEVALETETLLASEDAVIAAAAAEAVALAKAAVKAARDAALMIRNNQNSENKHSTFLSEADTALLKKTRLRNTEIVGLLGESSPSETQVEKGHYDLEPTHDELELLQEKLSENIDARSKRLSERKAKRTRASEKAAAGFVPPKHGSTSRKKRAALQDIDYSDPLRYLRGTTSSTKLLTAAEEQEFSAGIQDLLKLEKVHEELEERYGGKPTFAQWAAALGVDQKTLNKRLNHGILCKEKMIKSNIRLVISIAKNYQNAGMSIQDLVQEGCRGLVRGAEKFDASKGFKFSTYAHWWIKQSVRKSLSDQSRTIRLPFHMVEATYKVKEARKQLYSENGRQPENEEVAEATGLSMKRLSTVLVTPKPPRSLDQKIGFNMNLKPSEVISNPAAETGEEQLIKQYMKQDLEKVLDSLSPRESQVVRLRFGMEDGRTKTLQEIGESMGVSRERIRQIESSAFRKLRNKKRIKPLQQYVVS